MYLFACLSLDDKVKIAGYTLADAITGAGEGIHFGGNTNQNTYMNFSYIPFTEQNKPEKSGIGQLPNAADSADARRIVVPTVRKSSRADGDRGGAPKEAGGAEQGEGHDPD